MCRLVSTFDHPSRPVGQASLPVSSSHTTSRLLRCKTYRAFLLAFVAAVACFSSASLRLCGEMDFGMPRRCPS